VTARPFAVPNQWFSPWHLCFHTPSAKSRSYTQADFQTHLNTSGTHFKTAGFPRELARRCILLGSRPGDLVLDPFSGSGTTGIVAVELRRQAILVELNEAYARESAAQQCAGVQERLWGKATRRLLPRRIAVTAEQTIADTCRWDAHLKTFASRSPLRGQQVFSSRRRFLFR